MADEEIDGIESRLDPKRFEAARVALRERCTAAKIPYTEEPVVEEIFGYSHNITRARPISGSAGGSGGDFARRVARGW
jgi:hypothetical protein